MHEKISAAAYLIALILNYINGSMYLLGVSLGFAIFTITMHLFIGFYITDPQVKEIKEKVSQMEDDGYSEEEISAFLEKSKTVDERKYQEPPASALIIYLFSMLAGLLFLIIGMINFLG